MPGKNQISVLEWLEQLQARGSYAFSLAAVKKSFPAHTGVAIKRTLHRLTKKGKVLSIYKGYYLILPPQYAAKGTLPPPLFLDAFMKFMERPYYVALLNAAAFHGASHQQAQEYFVMTDFPSLRATQRKNLKINYISIQHIPETLLEKRKTEAGFMNISNPALTASDLVQFTKRVGGLNRTCTILNELSETLQANDFSKEWIEHVHVSSIQRLGYLLEFICDRKQLASALWQAAQENELEFRRIPLQISASTKGFSSDNRWKVIVNDQIEIDD